MACATARCAAWPRRRRKRDDRLGRSPARARGGHDPARRRGRPLACARPAAAAQLHAALARRRDDRHPSPRAAHGQRLLAMELPPAPNSPPKGVQQLSSPIPLRFYPASALDGPGIVCPRGAAGPPPLTPSAGRRPPTSNEETASHPEVHVTRPLLTAPAPSGMTHCKPAGRRGWPETSSRQASSAWRRPAASSPAHSRRAQPCACWDRSAAGHGRHGCILLGQAVQPVPARRSTQHRAPVTGHTTLTGHHDTLPGP
jgi:hypothetical protein